MSDGDNVVQFPGPPEEIGDDLPAALRALLFAAGEPVTERELAEALGGMDPADVRDTLATMAETTGEGIRVVSVAGGWQMRTDPRFAEPIRRLRGGRPQTMSSAALEALSVVAYRQPVTRTEVDALRGVQSGGVMKLLLDKGYLRVVGRRDEPGRPLEYGTTPLFLELFELTSLADLPTVADREELGEASEDGEVDPDEGTDDGLTEDLDTLDDALDEDLSDPSEAEPTAGETGSDHDNRGKTE